MKLAQELGLHDIDQQDGKDEQGHDGADVEQDLYGCQEFSPQNHIDGGDTKKGEN